MSVFLVFPCSTPQSLSIVCLHLLNLTVFLLNAFESGENRGLNAKTVSRTDRQSRFSSLLPFFIVLTSCLCVWPVHSVWPSSSNANEFNTVVSSSHFTVDDKTSCSRVTTSFSFLFFSLLSFPSLLPLRLNFDRVQLNLGYMSSCPSSERVSKR